MRSWKQLVTLPPERLADEDIAFVNLACSHGLPLTENLNRDIMLERLDYFVEVVRRETRANWRRFKRNRYDYHNSEAYFVVLALVTVLQRDCGVRYNPFKIDEDARFDSADSFIFGILRDRGGTCASIPVTYVAVGRRLGYPLKLVSAFGGPKGTHLFARWEDGRERFNIEATAQGLRCPTDDYYRTGRYSVTQEVERKGCFLQSKTPRQELSGFLLERGFCLLDVGRECEAVEAFVWSSALDPENELKRNRMLGTIGKWMNRIHSQKPPGFPGLDLPLNFKQFPQSISQEIEYDVLALEAMDKLLRNRDLHERWWRPLRNGARPADLPPRIRVHVENVSKTRSGS